MQRKIDKSLEIVRDSINEFGNKIVLACSFGKDSIVLLHLCRRIKPDIQVVSVMTPFKFKETLAYKLIIEKLWNVNIRTYSAEKVNIDLLKDKGADVCCRYYKIAPLQQAATELQFDAWFSGLRNTEGGDMRKFTQIREKKADGLIKINPILDWTELDIWKYHAMNMILPHPLYLYGYRSLGCQPCSNIAESDDEPERARRWEGTKKIECGIHVEEHLRQ